MKGKHYWTQLRTALTGGLWGTPKPARAFKGEPISWPDLFRKFNKHCHGFEEIVEIASQTQAAALLVAGGAEDVDLDGDAHTVTSALILDGECIAAEERTEEVQAAHNAMRQLVVQSPMSAVRGWQLRRVDGH